MSWHDQVEMKLKKHDNFALLKESGCISFLVMFDIDVWRVWEEPIPKSFWLMFFVSASDIKMVARNTVVFRPLKAT